MVVRFHPLIWDWFTARFAEPTAPQERGWQCIAQGNDTLIAAPTGSGKTLAAFLWSIDRLINRAANGQLDDATSVVYVSPLKALGNDIAKNLQTPLAEIYRLAEAQGMLLPGLRVAIRSGDTPAGERQSMVRRPPHILITTPESLYILLTAEKSRNFLRTAETVIVDEIHAIAGDKRGAHFALSLERLDALAGRRLQRIGLSATQKPIEEIARLLVGTERCSAEGKPDCTIVDIGHRRDLLLSVEVPDQDLGPIATHDVWAQVYEGLMKQIEQHRTTLVFVNTRRLVERVAHQLTARLGEGKVGAHHGSLSRKTRLEVEQKLKSGELSVVVATASLELGIDIGHVDLVCHIGAPRALATLLQRVGRAGHWLGAIPKGILYPLTRDDLLQSIAAIRAVGAGELDQIRIPAAPLDVLAQQMVATVASVTPWKREKEETDKDGADSGMSEEDLWSLVRRAYPYRNLARPEFDQLLELLSEGVSSRRGRRSAHLHYDRVHRRLRARRGARLTAITNGGAIPDTADYEVIEAPAETFVGKVNEDFAIESLAGDIFLLGNKSWRIRRVASGKVWVEDAQGAPPSIPFWFGEAPARTKELSTAVSELRQEIASRLSEPGSAARWLTQETGIPEAGAEQVVAYVRETQIILGRVPTLNCIVAERFFDESGGMQLVVHSPFGGRINRAFGLALRKRFCVSFNREIQAAATDDGMVLSLGEEHSFPLETIFQWVRAASVEKDLIQAALAAPMFANRWRWNATRALALLRFSGGRRVPMAIQRMRAEDLLAAVFPEQLMCQDNRVGPVELPDHPLVNETIRDCLHEAMDLDGLKELLEGIHDGEIQTVAVDTVAPSPMAHEILNANPYAFLDDAPLEERRARAVSLRQTDPDLARGLGALSQEAIDEVRSQAWPPVRDPDELHDLLLSAGLLPLGDAEAYSGFAGELIRASRATLAVRLSEIDGRQDCGYVAAERLHLVRLVFPDMQIEPVISGPVLGSVADRNEAVRRIIQGWMEIVGPATAKGLACKLGLKAEDVEKAFLALEASGVVLRGYFTPGRIDGGQVSEAEIEWCERGLLARIHRLTLGRLRREIEAVTAADFIQFLFRWQHVEPGSQLRGRGGILEIIGQLQGLELPAPAWEQFVLPSRVADYDPQDLESLCLGGAIVWGRIRGEKDSGDEEGEKPQEATPSALSQRKTRRRFAFARNAPIAFLLREELGYFLEAQNTTERIEANLSSAAVAVARFLRANGASFLADIARGAGLLKSQAEAALWELVARGLVTGDGIAGLRVLLTPEAKRQGRRQRLKLLSGGRSADRLMPVGRWSLWRAHGHSEVMSTERRDEFLARQLLRRYGVVFRELLARESARPSWRVLVQIYRRLEARGEIRGGRFVNGFIGEQYALPEAVETLRRLRRSPSENGGIVVCAAADPLNLVGVLTPGERVSSFSNQSIAYANGVPIDVGPLGAIRSRLQQPRVGSGD